MCNNTCARVVQRIVKRNVREWCRFEPSAYSTVGMDIKIVQRCNKHVAIAVHFYKIVNKSRDVILLRSIYIYICISVYVCIFVLLHYA